MTRQNAIHLQRSKSAPHQPSIHSQNDHLQLQQVVQKILDLLKSSATHSAFFEYNNNHNEVCTRQVEVSCKLDREEATCFAQALDSFVVEASSALLASSASSDASTSSVKLISRKQFICHNIKFGGKIKIENTEQSMMLVFDNNQSANNETSQNSNVSTMKSFYIKQAQTQVAAYEPSKSKSYILEINLTQKKAIKNIECIKNEHLLIHSARQTKGWVLEYAELQPVPYTLEIYFYSTINHTFKIQVQAEGTLSTRKLFLCAMKVFTLLFENQLKFNLNSAVIVI